MIREMKYDFSDINDTNIPFHKSKKKKWNYDEYSDVKSRKNRHL